MQLPSTVAKPDSAPEFDSNNYGKKIGILVVAYNAVTTLSKVLTRIPQSVWANVAEVAVFDDASQDATYELAIGYKHTVNVTNLHVVKHVKNRGYGGNQKAGYRYFMEKGYDAVVLLHGDGQYAPECLASLYHPLVTGQADAVLGSRMMTDFGGPLKGGMPLYKFIGNKILSFYENKALSMSLTEFHSGYRAYSIQALRQIDFSEMTDDFHFDTQILIKLNHQGFRITEVPIPTYYGDEICYVDGMKYARDCAIAVNRFNATIKSRKAYPEFKEYFAQYPLKEARYSSHYYFEQNIGTGKSILDIGCGDGFLASRIAGNGNRVTGVDIIPAPRFRESFENYISADVSSDLDNVVRSLSGKQFDSIVLMDVLEHLAYPNRMLTACRQMLKPGGTMLISVPNVANLTVRASLLIGKFDYQDRGILDKTHLRFFTRKSFRRLLADADLEINRERTTLMPIELVLGLNPTGWIMKGLGAILASLTRAFPTIFGYQYFVVARFK